MSGLLLFPVKVLGWIAGRFVQALVMVAFGVIALWVLAWGASWLALRS